jgi:hypothetical protein
MFPEVLGPLPIQCSIGFRYSEFRGFSPSPSVRFRCETPAIASNLRANKFFGLSASGLRNQSLALGPGFGEAQDPRDECVVRIIYIRGHGLRNSPPSGANFVWRIFWQQRMTEGREAVSWEKVLRLLVVNRWIDSGSEFRVYRHWLIN